LPAAATEVDAEVDAFVGDRPLVSEESVFLRGEAEGDLLFLRFLDNEEEVEEDLRRRGGDGNTVLPFGSTMAIFVFSAGDLSFSPFLLSSFFFSVSRFLLPLRLRLESRFLLPLLLLLLLPLRFLLPLLLRLLLLLRFLLPLRLRSLLLLRLLPPLPRSSLRRFLSLLRLLLLSPLLDLLLLLFATPFLLPALGDRLFLDFPASFPASFRGCGLLDRLPDSRLFAFSLLGDRLDFRFESSASPPPLTRCCSIMPRLLEGSFRGGEALDASRR